MRITYVLPSLAVGGAEYQSINQLNELSKRGYATQLIVLSDIKYLIHLLDPQIDVHFMNQLDLKSVNIRSFRSILRIRNEFSKQITAFNPQFIIAHLPVAQLACRMIKAINSGKSKLICYHHSTHFAIYPNDSLKRNLFQTFNNQLIKQDAGNIFISKAVQDDVTSHMKLNNGVIINNAVPEVEVNSDQSSFFLQKFNLKEKQYYIIPGRIERIKGQAFFLEAAATLIKKHKLTIVFAGTGGYVDHLQDIITANDLKDHVVFTGIVSNQEILALMKHASFVIIPSLFEGFGNVAIEALMLGKTVIASNAGGLPEVITDGQNGYLFEKENEESLNHLLEKVIENGNQFEKNPSAQKQVYKTNYTIENQVTTMLSYLSNF